MTTIRSRTVVGAAALCAALAHLAPGQAQAPQLGFFRQSDQPQVILQYAPNFYCHVQNEDQMAAYGGFGQVRVVPRLPLRGTPTGNCGWPDGFYRVSNAPEVYRLSGGAGSRFRIGAEICHVVNEDQMTAYGGFARVRVVQPASELGRGRGPVVDCTDP